MSVFRLVHLAFASAALSFMSLTIFGSFGVFFSLCLTITLFALRTALCLRTTFVVVRAASSLRCANSVPLMLDKTITLEAAAVGVLTSCRVASPETDRENDLDRNDERECDDELVSSVEREREDDDDELELDADLESVCRMVN